MSSQAQPRPPAAETAEIWIVGAKTGSEPSTTALFDIKKDYFELGLRKSCSRESKAENVELEISRTDVGVLGDPNYS